MYTSGTTQTRTHIHATSSAHKHTHTHARTHNTTLFAVAVSVARAHIRYQFHKSFNRPSRNYYHHHLILLLLLFVIIIRTGVAGVRYRRIFFVLFSLLHFILKFVIHTSFFGLRSRGPKRAVRIFGVTHRSYGRSCWSFSTTAGFGARADGHDDHVPRMVKNKCLNGSIFDYHPSVARRRTLEEFRDGQR